MFAQAVFSAPRSSIPIFDPRSSLPKFSPSMQQVFVKFSCNAMMGVIDYNDDADDDDADDDDANDYADDDR